MIILGPTDLLEVVTSTIADVHVTVSWKDESGRFFSNSVAISAAADSTAVNTLGMTSQSSRGIVSIHIVNVHASDANTVSVQRDVAGTEYTLISGVILAAGMGLHYESGYGWSVA